MDFKILITGRNRKVAGDIGSHLEQDRGYKILKCDPNKNALFDLLLAELPKVVIICLGGETSDNIRAYDVLKNSSKTGNCTTIVVSNEEDEKIFIQYTELEKVLFLSRPVSLFALYEKIGALEEEAERNKEKYLNSFREFVNENANMDSRRKSILVVDDDTQQLIHIKEQLEEFYNVSVVKSGEAAFKFLTKKKPNLILLDYMMPDQDGPEVLKKLRTVDEYADIPVIFLTGVTEKNTVIDTLTVLRPQGYIIKPSKKSEIVAKIIEVLG